MKVNPEGFHAEADGAPTDSRHRDCTDVNSLCYNLVAGRDSCSGLVITCRTGFGQWFISMVSINLRIWFYGAEMGEAGDTVEREESQ